MAGGMECYGLGDTCIAEPLFKGNAGTGITLEVKNKVQRPLTSLFREEEHRFPAQGQVEQFPGLDHALLYLETVSLGSDVSPDQG